MSKGSRRLIFMIIFFSLIFCGSASAATPNSSGTHLTVSASYPDLVVTRVTAPVRGVKGFTISVPNTVKNIGTRSSGGFYVNFYMKTSSVSPNIYVGRRFINNLNAGATNTKNTTLTIPKNMNSTTYYIRVYADFYKNVTESNESNNYLYSSTKISIIDCRPVYLTSDNIQTLTKDSARLDSIVAGLKSMGLNAVNYGIGPNKHYSILTNATIPNNALIVNIYGGVCAGTIWEMNLPYFKNNIGGRKIFSIWINTLTNIDNLTNIVEYTTVNGRTIAKYIPFLPRSHDDTFTPIYGKTNGFPDVYDLNHNGVIDLPGEDGLMDPARLLTNWGYHYFYLRSGDVATLVSKIFTEASSTL